MTEFEKFEEQVLSDLLRLAGQHAENVMIKMGQDLVPTWALVDVKKRIKILSTPWRDEEEKAMYRAGLKFAMTMNEVVAYSFVTEAWAATLERGEYENPMGRIPPSQRADRREVVVACAATASASKVASWAIERDGAGKVTALVSHAIPDSEQGQFESWLVEMLK
jgi:hypothetical protein